MRGSMSGRMHGVHSERTYFKLLSFIEQEIELAPIHREVRAEIVDVAKAALDFADPASGHGAGAVALFKERHGRQVVRMRMGIDHVGDRKIPGVDVLRHGLRRPEGCARALRIVIQHRVDHDPGPGIVNHVGQRRRCRIEKMLDFHLNFRSARQCSRSSLIVERASGKKRCAGCGRPCL